jgi:SSS family solute:Na+ symporter
MGLVAWISYRLTRGRVDDSRGYFLAGRSLTGTFIAGSLLLTNISAEQIVGLAGSAYAFNLSSMAWEVMAVVAIIIMAIVFLPRYLANGFTTLPEFLGTRFAPPIRYATVALFLLGYGLVTIPSVLYSGTIAVLQTFTGDLAGANGFFWTMLAIALLGAAYSVAGGLRAVAVSDTLNGIGLVFFGVLIPLLALDHLGAGSIAAGWETIRTVHPEKLNAVGTATDPTPFLTLFTGMIFANLAYWGTNQYVIQRTLAARSLAAGQKGVLLAGFFKLLIPFFVMLPGVIAFHLYGSSLGSMDEAYPRLVKDVLPGYLAGVFLAVLLGTVFSSFNSLLQSAATLITFDLYVPFARREVSDAERIRIGRYAGIALTLAGLCVAPMLQLAPDGLWQLIRKFTGFYNIPIIAIVLAALFIPRASNRAAIVAIAFHVPAYAFVTFVWDGGLHFVHWYAVLFALEMLILYWVPGDVTVAAQRRAAPVDLTPWRYRWWVVGALVTVIFALYFALSPIGIAS